MAALAQSAPNSRVTLIDIAQDANVSRATVSLVLRNVPVVADQTRQRVLDSMRRLGYVYHRGAASLRTQRTRSVGLVVTDIANPFFAEIIVTIEERLEKAGYVTLLGNTSETAAKQQRLVKTMEEYPVDGLLVCSSADGSHELAEQIRRCRAPKVLVARSLPDLPCDYAGVDNRHGAELAVTHLINLGHRRIAFLGGPSGISSRDERVAGYQKTLRKHGLHVFESPESKPTREGGYQLMQEFLRQPDPPTAALCFNDLVAIGVMEMLVAAERKPGKDFSIVGFNNVSEAAVCRPTLTTIDTMPRQIGANAAELLLRRIQEPDAPFLNRLVRPRLVLRESSGYLNYQNSNG
jgi:LacI family transcriptional regulator